MPLAQRMGHDPLIRGDTLLRIGDIYVHSISTAEFLMAFWCSCQNAGGWARPDDDDTDADADADSIPRSRSTLMASRIYPGLFI